MTTAATTDPQRPVRRHPRPAPKGEAAKVILALVLNAILFALVVA